MTLSPVGGPGSQPPIKKPTPQQEAEGMKKLGEIAADTAAGAVAGSIIPGLGTVLGAAAGFAFGVVHTVVEGAIESMAGEGGDAAPPGSDFEAPTFDPAAAADASAASDAPATIDPEVAEAFKQRDKDGDGVLTGDELNGLPGIDQPWLNPSFDPGMDGTVTLEQFAQRSGQIKEQAKPAYDQEQAAKLKAFKDFLLTDTLFKNGVNVATDGKYDDPAILKAVQDFYEAGKKQGLSDDEIKTAVKEFDKAFTAWQGNTGTPRPEPSQFLQHRYHQTVM